MTELLIEPVALPAETPSSGQPRLRLALHQIAGWAIFSAVVITALFVGLWLRKWAWVQSEPIRYTTDVNNAFVQGTDALRIGYFDRYDEQMSRSDPEGGHFRDLDYAPGRLAIATLWTNWVRKSVDGPIPDYAKLRPWPEPFYTRARELHRQDELMRPLLMVNLTGEILSAIAMFFLVNRYTSRRGLQPVRGNVLGIVASLFFWFDPAIICNAHCWPQWDSWVVPFFLWAVLLASWDCWFCAGAVIAMGAMFKGQILFGTPVFLLWPLFQGRLPAVARWIVGLLTAVAVITAMWMVRVPGSNPTGDKFIPGYVNVHAIEWLVYLGLIFTTLPFVMWFPKHPKTRLPIAILLAAILAWLCSSYLGRSFSLLAFVLLSAVAWLVNDLYPRWSWQMKLPLGLSIVGLLIYPIWVIAPGWLDAFAIATIVMAVVLSVAPGKVLPFAAAGWMSIALLLCAPIFGTSHGWFELGIAYGTHHYERMSNGQINNLAELLQERWNWEDLMAPAYELDRGPTADHIAKFLNRIDPGVHLKPGDTIQLPLKYVLVSVWLIGSVICALGAAIHDRNRSPRFLASIAAPWILLFAVMVQMHQRYLLWGASISAASAVLGPGFALLHLFLSTVSTSQELHSMMNNHLDYRHPVDFTNTSLYQFIDAWNPGIAWAVLLTALIFVYKAVKWDERLTAVKASNVKPTVHSEPVKVEQKPSPEDIDLRVTKADFSQTPA